MRATGLTSKKHQWREEDQKQQEQEVHNVMIATWSWNLNGWPASSAFLVERNAKTGCS
jgi:hypothetical protein